MEKTPPKPMTPFDALVNPPSLYMLKLLLPYLPASVQRMLAVLLKFSELRFTMDQFRGFNEPGPEKASGSILSDLKPYMDPEEQEMMEQMESMMNMMEMAQQMQQAGDGSASPFDFMQGMMDPGQPDLNFSFGKDQTHERMDQQPGHAEH